MQQVADILSRDRASLTLKDVGKLVKQGKERDVSEKHLLQVRLAEVLLIASNWRKLQIIICVKYYYKNKTVNKKRKLRKHQESYKEAQEPN